MGVHVGRLGQIAAVDHIARVELREALEDVPGLVLALRHVHVLDDVVGDRIDHHVPGRAVPGDVAAAQRRHHVLARVAARRLDAEGPEHGAEIAADAHRIQILGVVAEARLIALHELQVGGELQLLEVGLGADDAAAFLRAELLVLVADAEGHRDDRDLVQHARRVPLAVEAGVRRAHEAGGEPVGLGFLNLGDGRAELRHVEREEVLGEDLGAMVAREELGPLADDLGRIVVGADVVAALAVGPEAVVGHRLHPLHGGHAADEVVDVADAALVDHAVPEEGLEAPEDRPDDLARGTGDAAVHQVDALLERRFLGVLGIELHVGLRIVLDQPYLLAEQAAGRVDLLDRELAGLGHRRAVDVEAAGLVEDAGDDDLVVVRISLGRCRKTRRHQRCGGTRRALEKTSPSAVEHGSKPLSLFVERVPPRAAKG